MAKATSEALDHPTEIVGNPSPTILGDQDVIDDEALRRARLRGSLAQGDQWRRRREVRVVRRLLTGLVVAVIAVALVAAVAFVRVKLAQQAEQKRQQQERLQQMYPSATSTPRASAAPTMAASR